MKIKDILFHFADYNHVPEREKLNEYGGIGYYRIVKPAQYIGKLKTVKVVGKEILKFGKTFESLWGSVFSNHKMFWMNHFLGEPNASAQAFFSNRYKRGLVYDLDDNFLDVPSTNEMYEKLKPGSRDRAILSATLSFATTLVASTDPLKDKLVKHFKDVYGIDKNVVVIPNMNDIKDWDYTPVPKHGDKIVIGYSGSNSHQDDLVMVMPSIAKLMKKHKNLYFELIGCVPKAKVKEYFGNKGFDNECLDRIKLLPATPIFKDYPEYLSQQAWDIGICPLVDTEFTRSKSHIKWMEYSMYQIPTVASRVYPYFMDIQGRKTITDGETGLLAKPHEWEAKLESLIVSKELRDKLGKAAYDHIKKNWQYKNYDWKAALDLVH
jgi:glycosyltransferase involved in cell wall biosynthesis